LLNRPFELEFYLAHSNRRDSVILVPEERYLYLYYDCPCDCRVSLDQVFGAVARDYIVNY